jgi:hypothetical protein
MHIPTVKFDPTRHIDLGPDMDGRMHKPSPIENPWLKLPSSGPYILEIDGDDIKRYNEKRKNPHKRVMVESIPEPFIGNPRSAKLVLLSLNPGHSDGDAKAHASPEFRGAMCHNLRHELQEYPFYPLNPKFASTPCGQWWFKHTRELIDGCDRVSVAKGLLVIEWFPYHSQKSGLTAGKLVCESQRYSFQLAKHMRDRNVLMILLRSKKHWANVDERFAELQLPKSPQSPFITRGNFGEDLFRQMREALGCNSGKR